MPSSKRQILSLSQELYKDVCVADERNNWLPQNNPVGSGGAEKSELCVGGMATAPPPNLLSLSQTLLLSEKVVANPWPAPKQWSDRMAYTKMVDGPVASWKGWSDPLPAPK